MLLAFAALVLGLSQQAVGQDDATTLPDITVSATRPTERQAQRFVDEVATTPLHALTLARWMTPICIATVNLREDLAIAIRTRVEARAREVGVAILPVGCSPNITIVATSDGRFTASELVDEYHERFIVSDGPTQGDERDLRRFAEAEVAVRWWTISALMDEDSKRILVPIWGAPAAVVNTTGDPFYGQNRREGMLTSLVILDLSRTNGVSDAVLGDYVSMAVLTPLDPDLRAEGYPSILNLWDGGATTDGLTAWDRAYLKALYEAPVRLSGSVLQTRSLYQRSEMARIMARELSGAPSAP